MVTTIYLIRHGETDWNTIHRLQGHKDIPLNETGKQQAESLYHFLKEKAVTFDAILSSSLKRAYQTAEIALDRALDEITLLEGLRERNYGIYEGELWQDLAKRDANGKEKLNLREPTAEIPQGESISVFATRVLESFREIATTYPDKKIAIFTHGGVIDIVWRHLNSLDLLSKRETPILNGSINIFSIDKDFQWQALAWGKASHLAIDSLDDVGI